MPLVSVLRLQYFPQSNPNTESLQAQCRDRTRRRAGGDCFMIPLWESATTARADKFGQARWRRARFRSAGAWAFCTWVSKALAIRCEVFKTRSLSGKVFGMRCNTPTLWGSLSPLGGWGGPPGVELRHPRWTDGVPSSCIAVTPKYFCPQNPEGIGCPVPPLPVLSKAISEKSAAAGGPLA